MEEPHGRSRLGAITRLLVLAALAAVAALAAWSYRAHRRQADVPLPPNFGNFERVAARLTERTPRESFSFGVVGDTCGFGTFERIMERFRGASLDFLVHVGDGSLRPYPEDHRWFRSEVAARLRTAYPVFFVPGNHDVRPGCFDLADFERTYGPRQFHFSYGGHLFVFLHFLEKRYDPELRVAHEARAYLERVLASERAKADKVFVFQHLPPPIGRDSKMQCIPGGEKLFELFDGFGVNYVFSGHYHAYARRLRKRTAYLVVGGGGQKLRDVEYGAFHHAMVITVRPDGVSEDILPVASRRDLREVVKYYAVVRFWPWARARPAPAALLGAGWLAAALLALFRPWRRRRPERESVSDRGGEYDASAAEDV